MKVVILGWQPHVLQYNNDGLAFSAPRDLSYWDSLPAITKNLLTEYFTDICPESPPKTASLHKWAKRGVLLMNVMPVSRAIIPGQPQGYGWEDLAKEVLETVWLNNPRAVFVLMQPLPQKFNASILPKEATVLSIPGPSPRTADQGFLGSDIFTRINDELRANGLSKINWKL